MLPGATTPSAHKLVQTFGWSPHGVFWWTWWAPNDTRREAGAMTVVRTLVPYHNHVRNGSALSCPLRDAPFVCRMCICPGTARRRRAPSPVISPLALAPPSHIQSESPHPGVIAGRGATRRQIQSSLMALVACSTIYSILHHRWATVTSVAKQSCFAGRPRGQGATPESVSLGTRSGDTHAKAASFFVCLFACCRPDLCGVAAGLKTRFSGNAARLWLAKGKRDEKSQRVPPLLTDAQFAG